MLSLTSRVGIGISSGATAGHLDGVYTDAGSGQEFKIYFVLGY